LAASTHAGEDESILQAHQNLLQYHAETLLILAPRHPERCDKVAELIEQHQLTYQRSSLTSTANCDSQILLIDSIGQLMQFYGTADLAFIGGSIIPHGGHNPIEPAAWGMPILAGPHLFNFAHVSQLLQSAGAMQLVNKTEELAEDVRYYIEYPSQREVAAQAGRTVVTSNQGALQRLLALIDPLLKS
jgi:3-deoxy-D-manno-octulosonic-acid transferase